MARIVILGGGFGGLAGAHELKGLLGDTHQITLVDRADRFAMGFAKLWDLGRVRPLAEGTVMLADLAKRGVEFVQADIENIDPVARSVSTSAGELEADALLVALGAGPAPKHRQMVSGPGAHDLYDAEHLPAMHADLDAIESGRIVISILGGPFKCPPAPYEAALLIDERLRRRGVRDAIEIVVTTPQPITLPVAGPDASQYVASHLGERGIAVRAETKVVDVDGDARRLGLDDGSTLEYSLFFGVPAAAPPPVISASALVGESGWIEPDRLTLQTSFDGVYAVGDCTMIPNAAGQLPKAGVFAAGEARVAAHNIAAGLGVGEPAEFDGHGFCFLEIPGPKVAFVEGNFYAEPKPDVHLTEADEEQFARKQAYERDHLTAWIGG